MIRISQHTGQTGPARELGNRRLWLKNRIRIGFPRMGTG